MTNLNNHFRDEYKDLMDPIDDNLSLTNMLTAIGYMANDIMQDIENNIIQNYKKYIIKYIYCFLMNERLLNINNNEHLNIQQKDAAKRYIKHRILIFLIK